ncbi:nucleotidyltransferase [Halalkalibacillus sediminis]|uniref:Nucleotidyltransferase n=1 Tax=Halalkalibacillus sediminis TaxID=2018042 RepID=A0A2I0QTH4_9BACI|nr:nucleotidyltransferase substrate binding protein [Halalkalibacillus sediminis]PKR77604.1 nucleotidyltransferase [Halalkalibacillus sediminis]
MDPYKEGRWKEQFEKFEKSFELLEKYQDISIDSEIERTGMIHFFEMSMEHAYSTLFDYLDAKGNPVESKRHALKEIKEYPFIQNHRTWMKIYNRRNLAYYLFTEKVARQLTQDIQTTYYPELKYFYQQLSLEK